MRNRCLCRGRGGAGKRGVGGRGFALWEAAAALTALALLTSIVCVGLAESRRQASLGDNLANLRQFGAATSYYAADNADRLWNYSWRAGVQYVPGVPPAVSDAHAASNQALWIIRRRADPTMPNVTNWIPHLTYSHLVLADYFELAIPSRWWASPEDAALLALQATPPGGGAASRPRYSSSYDLPPAFWSPDARLINPTINTVAQGSTHALFSVPSATPLGHRLLSDIAFPSHKAMLYDRYQRHFGPQIAFFAYDAARVPMLMADGSAAVRCAAESNPGFRPNSPLASQPTTFAYAPAASEPGTLSGATQDTVTGRFRWTRSGLRGRDFGGPEVPWTD